MAFMNRKFRAYRGRSAAWWRAYSNRRDRVAGSSSAPANAELREDGGYELREDGGYELRE